ncbi:hypothetical protein GCM10010293_42150 [Streptomyces griseoflavus]|nr:hypothetical protein GCM10010293_42150 [Streptomyces griseoflavus]
MLFAGANRFTVVPRRACRRPGASGRALPAPRPARSRDSGSEAARGAVRHRADGGLKGTRGPTGRSTVLVVGMDSRTPATPAPA